MDCECFTKRTFNDLGIPLGWWTEQLNYGRRISLANPRPGDLLFFSEDGSGNLPGLAPPFGKREPHRRAPKRRPAQKNGGTVKGEGGPAAVGPCRRVTSG